MNIKPAFTACMLIAMLAALTFGCAKAQILGGPIALSDLKDGIYEGKAKNGPVNVVAKVTVQDLRIANIQLIEHRNWKGKAAENIIPERIINQQSTRVDVVSGATMSSTAIMNAVEAAVQKAK